MCCLVLAYCEEKAIGGIIIWYVHGPLGKMREPVLASKIIIVRIHHTVRYPLQLGKKSTDTGRTKNIQVNSVANLEMRVWFPSPKGKIKKLNEFIRLKKPTIQN